MTFQSSPAPLGDSAPSSYASTVSNVSVEQVTSLPDGAYVTAAGSYDTLFRIQNGRRYPVDSSRVASLGITQKDVHEVDPLALYSLPLPDASSRAVGREVRSYLWSDLKSGHYMQSWAWLQGTTLTLTTRTETITLFGGYTGGVRVVLFDANGTRINHTEIKDRYGIDGRAFGPGTREDTITVQLPQSVTDAAESIVICHYWDPKVDLIKTTIQVALFIWDLIKMIDSYKQKGEPVNGGGQPF